MPRTCISIDWNVKKHQKSERRAQKDKIREQAYQKMSMSYNKQ